MAPRSQQVGVTDLVSPSRGGPAIGPTTPAWRWAPSETALDRSVIQDAASGSVGGLVTTDNSDDDGRSVWAEDDQFELKSRKPTAPRQSFRRVMSSLKVNRLTQRSAVAAPDRAAASAKAARQSPCQVGRRGASKGRCPLRLGNSPLSTATHQRDPCPTLINGQHQDRARRAGPVRSRQDDEA